MEKKTRHYEFEGAVFDILLFYDELVGRYIEEYRNFNEDPVWTADGFPITHSVEDACPWGEWDRPGRCRDCGSCRFFTPIAARTRIGVCRQEKRLRYNETCRLEEMQK
ncbi:MAG: hypothetical protein LIO81_09725 [Clostridiales bacterium]|nr:hypothetical protein [Clostridiales bacterium]